MFISCFYAQATHSLHETILVTAKAPHCIIFSISQISHVDNTPLADIVTLHTMIGHKYFREQVDANTSAWKVGHASTMKMGHVVGSRESYAGWLLVTRESLEMEFNQCGWQVPINSVLAQEWSNGTCPEKSKFGHRGLYEWIWSEESGWSETGARKTLALHRTSCGGTETPSWEAEVSIWTQGAAWTYPVSSRVITLYGETVS